MYLLSNFSQFVPSGDGLRGMVDEQAEHIVFEERTSAGHGGLRVSTCAIRHDEWSIMNRRNFGQLMAGTLLAPAWAQTLPASKGVRFSFMLWAIEKQASFDRCVEIVAAAGYQGIELTGEFHQWSAEETRRVMVRMRSLGMVFDAMSGVKAGFAVPAESEAFFAQFAEHLKAAKVLECPQVILLSGKRVGGLEAQAQRNLAIENLKRAAE